MGEVKVFFKKDGVQSVLSSLFCIFFGLLIGYAVLFAINPGEASNAIVSIIKNFFWYPNRMMRLRAFGTTLVKTAPLIMCSLSVLFAYKTGLFNIGVCGQYVAGSGMCLIFALKFHSPWFVCMFMALVAGVAVGSIIGFLKSKCNVNEVISCIMINWIILYGVNMMLSSVKEVASPYTVQLTKESPSSLIPSFGLKDLFGKNKYMTVAIFLSVIFAILIWFVLDKTRFGYEIKATGLNKNAARYCGMNEKMNVVCTMAISGGLAALGGSFYYLSGFEQWVTTSTSLPSLGFNGIAAAFLGGLNPIGTIFSSYFIQHITDGGSLINKNVYSAHISDLISSIIIYLCAFVMYLKLKFNAFMKTFWKNEVTA